MTTFKTETSCVLLKSYKHPYECRIITSCFFLQEQHDISSCSQTYIAFMFTSFMFTTFTFTCMFSIVLFLIIISFV